MNTALKLNDQELADVKERTSLARLIEKGFQLRLHATANSALQGGVRLLGFKGRGGPVQSEEQQGAD